MAQGDNIIAISFEPFSSYGETDVEITNSTCVIFSCVDPTRQSTPFRWMDPFICFPPPSGQMANISLISVYKTYKFHLIFFPQQKEVNACVLSSKCSEYRYQQVLSKDGSLSQLIPAKRIHSIQKGVASTQVLGSV